MHTEATSAGTAASAIRKASAKPPSPETTSAGPDETKIRASTGGDAASPATGTTGERVTSELAAEMIAMAGGEAGNALKGPLPLEMYAVPSWYADFGFTLPSELGVSANWFAEKYPEAAASTKDERNEYSSLVRKHYRNVMDKHGIDSTAGHYRATIADKNLSETLRQEMADLVRGDARLMELMDRVGKRIV
jgi:hypothetical protein